jgi:hypothetical protein
MVRCKCAGGPADAVIREQVSHDELVVLTGFSGLLIFFALITDADVLER